MKLKVVCAVIAASLLTVSGSAQQQAAMAGDDAIFTPEAFRSHVAFLADDLLEGREPGTRGYDIAARYVATQMEGLGLRPGNGRDWLQQIEFVDLTVSGTPELSIGGRTFRHGTEIVARAMPLRQAARVEAPLVFVGYGLYGPAAGVNDYEGLDVRGKIVVMLSGVPEGLPSDVAAHLNNQKAIFASRQGAVGIISIRSNRESRTTPFARLAAPSTRPTVTWLERNGRPFTGHDLQFSIAADTPVAEAMFAGAPRPFAQVMREADARRRVRGFPLRQTARVAAEPARERRYTSPNVVAVLPGTDPALANEYVLLMAHLDAYGIIPEGRRPELTDRIRNGAIDNATGISTLIEVARQMSRPGHRPRRPILFAAVNAEELGLLGAEFLARHPVVNGRIAGVVNLDMPILTYEFEDVIAFGAEHSTMGPTVPRAAARMGVRLADDPLPEEGLFTRSDHYKFVREGIPSVFLMTGFSGPGREQFTSFLRTQYHQHNDDMNLPISWTAGARFARLNYLIAREIADAPQAPLWYADSFFGRTFGEGQQTAERPQTRPERPRNRRGAN